MGKCRFNKMGMLKRTFLSVIWLLACMPSAAAAYNRDYWWALVFFALGQASALLVTLTEWDES